MNVDDLKAGRDLDALVEERVFGLTPCDAPLRPEGQWLSRHCNHAPGTCFIPGYQAYYSKSLSASLRVEVWLRSKGWHRTETITGEQATPLQVVFRHDDGNVLDAVGELEEAICKVALKAAELQSPSDGAP